MGTITAQHLSKAYKQYPHRWGRLLEWFFPKAKPRHTLKWVLKDLNFSVQAGEAMGIIGMNGAGKSTLLKMITGTTLPNKGSVKTQGKIAALLELGMGFHPDFTGRQNVLMAGQLLGHSVEQIMQCMPDIEAFAEVGEYLDQPVRTYSSGMQMRLAFSVATAIRPDILIVDEALSVGDAYFQHKSFERIRQFNQQGTTLLIVSHDKNAIMSICSRAILLNQGQVAIEGAPEVVMDFYNALLADHQNQSVQQLVREDGRIQTISGSLEATVLAVNLCDTSGTVLEVVNVGQEVVLRIKFKALQAIERLICGYGIKDRFGRIMFGTNTEIWQKPLLNVGPNDEFILESRFVMNLGPGTYSIQTALTSTDTHLANNYEWRELALIFGVINIGHPYFEGSTWLDPQMTLCANKAE
jgi:lipopolysaccharide transport system ATP-binding protein